MNFIFTLIFMNLMAFGREFRESHADLMGSRLEMLREQRCREWNAKEAPVCRQNISNEVQRLRNQLSMAQNQLTPLEEENSSSLIQTRRLKSQIDGLEEAKALALQELAWFDRAEPKKSEFWPGGALLRDFPAVKGKAFQWREVDSSSRKARLKLSLEENDRAIERKKIEHQILIEGNKPLENQISHLKSVIQDSQNAISSTTTDGDRNCNSCPY